MNGPGNTDRTKATIIVKFRIVVDRTASNAVEARLRPWKIPTTFT